MMMNRKSILGDYRVFIYRNRLEKENDVNLKAKQKVIKNVAIGSIKK
jgi:hypothetical protein